MKDDRRRLRRAHLIERIRETDKRRAATAAHAAEVARAKLAGISERTLSLGEAYAGRSSIADGAELRSVVALSTQLHALGVTAARQADRARLEADTKMAELASADRRHKRAGEERRGLIRQLLDQQQRAEIPLGGQTGTDLD